MKLQHFIYFREQHLNDVFKDRCEGRRQRENIFFNAYDLDPFALYSSVNHRRHHYFHKKIEKKIVLLYLYVIGIDIDTILQSTSITKMPHNSTKIEMRKTKIEINNIKRKICDEICMDGEFLSFADGMVLCTNSFFYQRC